VIKLLTTDLFDRKILPYYYITHFVTVEAEKYISRLQKESDNLQKQFEQFIKAHTYKDEGEIN